MLPTAVNITIKLIDWVIGWYEKIYYISKLTFSGSYIGTLVLIFGWIAT